MLAAVVAALLFQVTPELAQSSPPTSGAMKYYPAQAWKEGVEGRAVIRCAVTKQGALADCVVASEAPKGAGFGKAALKMSPLFKMNPAIRDGARVDSEVDIPIDFQLPNYSGN
jgi:TonB family protein